MQDQKVSNINAQKNRCQQTLKTLDIFGYQVSLYYKGLDTYKSTTGGFFTVLCFLTILGYFAAQALRVVVHEGTSRSTFFYRDTYSDLTTYQLNTSNFDFGVGVNFRNPKYYNEIMEEYISIKFNQLEINFTDTGYAFKPTFFQPVRCGTERFLNDSSINSQRSIKEYYCADNFNMELMGSYGSLRTKTFYIQVVKCTDHTNQFFRTNHTCKNQSEIQEFLSQVEIYVAFMNQYFDLNDFSESYIKNYVQFYQNYLTDSLSYQSQVLLSMNNAVNYDSWSGFNLQGLNQNTSYLRIRTKQQLTAGIDHVTVKDRLLSYMIIMDEQVETTERVRMTIFDALSKTGGIMGLVLAFFQIAMKLTHRVEFFSRIIQHNYLYDSKLNECSKQNKRNRAALAQSSDGGNFGGDIESRQGGQTPGSKLESFYLKAISRIKNGQTLNYTLWDYIFAPFILLNCCKCQGKRAKRKLYETGYKRIYQELDIELLLRQSRVLRLLYKVNLSKAQRKLLRYSNESFFTKTDFDPPPSIKDFQSIREEREGDNSEEIRESLQRILKNKHKNKLNQRILKVIQDDKQLPKLEDEELNNQGEQFQFGEQRQENPKEGYKSGNYCRDDSQTKVKKIKNGARRLISQQKRKGGHKEQSQRKLKNLEQSFRGDESSRS